MKDSWALQARQSNCFFSGLCIKFNYLKSFYKNGQFSVGFITLTFFQGLLPM